MSADRTDRDDYLDSVLIGGREAVVVSIVEYDESWPVRFIDAQRRISAALGPVAVAVEHIGSTSVPGLAAKPIIDVLVTVADVEDETTYLPRLEQAGFVLRVKERGHRMLRTPDKGVHVHVYEVGDTAVDDYLVLRDWLRHSESDRTLYAATKRELAKRSWSDMNHYADAKTHVILRIMAGARDWMARRTSAD